MTPPIVYVDKRELRSPVSKELDLLGCDLKFVTLEVADYVVSDRCAFERKAVDDFFSSLFGIEKKLFGQLFDLANSYTSPILLFEGAEEDLFSRNVNTKAMQGIINEIALMRVPILYTLSPAGTASIIAQIANHEQNKNKRSISLHGKRSQMDKSEQLVYTLSSLTDCGIGSEQAKKLLSHFGSVERIVFADVEDLMKVDRIGEATAKKITEFFTRKYNNGKH